MSYRSTLTGPWKKMLATNSTDTSFASKIPKITVPSGDGVHLAGTDGYVPDAINCLFYGTGDDNDEFSVRIIGWRSIGVGPSPGILYIPIVLAELACVMCGTPGIALAPVVATELFVDTITRVTGNDGVSMDIVSPTAEEIAHVTLDIKGCSWLEFSFDTTTGNPTGCNGLFSWI